MRVDRGQLLLMPPSLAEWLPEDHLVWTVLGAVDQMDLSRFNEAIGWVERVMPPYDPAMLVALLMYAYSRGNRSSRGIERCVPGGCGVQGDHGDAHAGSLDDRGVPPPARGGDRGAVRRRAGAVPRGWVGVGWGDRDRWDEDQSERVDGSEPLLQRVVKTKILREAEETDQREDELYGDKRGDELPEELQKAETREPSTGGREA